MYSRSTNNQNNTRAQIPVESFGDSFSADAYLSQGFKEKVSDEAVCPMCESKASGDDCVQQQEHQMCKEGCVHKEGESSKCIFGDIKIDDLILIGLIIMFIKDGKNSNDFLIPILLAIVLLF